MSGRLELGGAHERVSVGHPVDVRSGVVFTAWHDFEFNGPPALVWRRFYSTAAAAQSVIGWGWTSPYLIGLQEAGDFVSMTGEEGHSHDFPAPRGQAPSFLAGHDSTMWRVDPRRIVVREADKRRHLHFEAGTAPGKYDLCRIEDYSGNAITFVRDATGLLECIRQERPGRQFRFSYADGLISDISVVVAGRQPLLLVHYDHDDQGRLIRSVDATGATMQYQYDSAGRLVREVNVLGGAFYFEYDGDGRCVHTWGDGGYLRRRLEFNAEHRTTRVSDSVGASTTYFYSRQGSLEKKIDPLGNVTRYVSAPGVEQKIDALGAVTHREFDNRGRLTRLKMPLDQEFLFTYNALGLRESIVDPGGATWKNVYDERGRLTKLIDPLGCATTFERDPRGDILCEIDAEGRRLERRTDATLRWTQIADALGAFRTEYDEYGRAVLSSDARGVLSIFRSDAAGRLIGERGEDGAETAMTRDKAGNITALRYRNGSTWSFEYDRFSHLVGVRGPAGDRVVLRYDTEGRRLAIVNHCGEEFRETYDACGRVTAARYFDGRRATFERDALGQIVSIRTSDGTHVRRTYDLRGNLREQTSSRVAEDRQDAGMAASVTSEYQYDWRGRVLKASNGDVGIEFLYDAAGRRVGERQDGQEIRLSYDKSGKLVRREYVGGVVGPVQFDRAASGQVAAIRDKRGIVASLDYDSTGRVRQRAMRGGMVEDLEYDRNRRLVGQRVRVGSRRVVERTYAYDAVDDVVGVVDSIRGTMSWKYDAELRLVSESRDGRTKHAYTYDPSGGLATHNDRAFRYEAGGRVCDCEGVQFRYDAAGRVVEQREGGDVTRFDYDCEGRLTSAARADGSVWTYRYDPLGRRVSKAGPSGSTRFVWCGTSLAAVRREGTDPVEVLIGSGSHQPSVQWIGDRSQHFVCNGLGTPQEIVQEDGEIAWTGEFEPYGRDVSGSVGSFCPWRLPGQYEDEETGLHYNYQRYYNPTVARYLTPDPIGLDGGIDLYAYPRDPVNWMDPLGLKCPNPRLIEKNDTHGWEVHEHADGSLTITADCTRGYATPKPHGLRPTIHAGDDNKYNPPEAHLGADGRLIVMEGTHRSAAASRGAQMPQDPDNPHLGGVPGRPGYMTYEYSPDFNDDQQGVPLQTLNSPPGYPHTW